ncbi:MAG: Trk system potassium transporter TrkA [Weeksellaceae bacterium]|nr:Trk system potassium transporter TrkA [Weeksellaceae bacterium]
MHIIIAGAGEVGFHIAKLLSRESQNITVVDLDKEKLEKIENKMDVLTYRGDSTSFAVLQEINVQHCDIFVAVTDLQNTNLVSALIAKKMGAKKSVARVSNPEYLKRENMLNVQRMGIDSLISPVDLAATEIFHLIEETAFNEIRSYENGLLNLLGTLLEPGSPLIGKSVREISERSIERISMPIAIARYEEGTNQLIIPRGDTVYQVDDQVYFLAVKNTSINLRKVLGKDKDALKDVMILGGGSIGFKAAKNLLKGNHRVKIIERDPKRAEVLAEELPGALVILGDARDTELWVEEGISDTDALVAVTGRSETNIMASLLAKNKGVKKTIALVENIDYIDLSQDIGIDTLINKKLMAADMIFKYVRQGRVLDRTVLADINAEILEYAVSEQASIAHTAIQDLKFPKNAIIGGIIRREIPIIPGKDFVVLPGDKVIVLTEHENIDNIARFFK